jgi:curli biogenesis system outer membrane secretion channel CsgG
MHASASTILAIACAAALSLASCASSPSSAPAPTKAAHKSSAAGRVAIFDFEVKGGGDAYKSLAGDIPESLSESFLKGHALVPLEREDFEKVLSEQELSLSGAVDDATAARVGKLAGARYALLGSASIIGGQARLSCRLIDIETAEIVYAASERGEAKAMFGLLDRLASDVEGGFLK